MFSMIGAITKNNCVGKDNTLPWKIPSDLRFFKLMSSKQIVVMGWNTYLSLGKKPLPDRRNIVIVDKNKSFIGSDGFEFMTFDEICYEQDRNISKEYFIIGGPKTWELFKDKYNSAIITRVDATINGDSFVSDNIFQNLKLIKSGNPVVTVDLTKDEYPYEIEIWNRK